MNITGEANNLGRDSLQDYQLYTAFFLTTTNHMSKPFNIDQSIGEMFNDTYFVYTEPHALDEYDVNDESDCLYAQAMMSLTEGNSQKGKNLLEQAYSMGNLSAGHALSYGYSCGWFGEKDYKSQMKILRELEHYHIPEVLNDIGCAYEYGNGVVKKNIRLAIIWFNKAVSEGSVSAMSNLAHIYLRGPEKYRDTEKGLLFAFRAADYDDEQAQNLLGLCYRFGIGLDEDYEKSIQYFKKAVKGGAGGCAEYNLSRCYELGIGTNVDLVKAEKYMRLAKKHGYITKKNQP